MVEETLERRVGDRKADKRILQVMKRPEGGYTIRHDPTEPSTFVEEIHDVLRFMDRLPTEVIQRSPIYEDIPDQEEQRLELYRKSII